MSMDYDRDNEHIRMGFKGEDIIRNYLKDQKCPFMQADLLFKIDNKWYLGEVKTQEHFKAPPFDGHGLPIWQLEARLNFYEDTGVEPILFIVDITNKRVFYQSFVKLNNFEKKFLTKNSKRIIFPFDAFEILITLE